MIELNKNHEEWALLHGKVLSMLFPFGNHIQNKGLISPLNGNTITLYIVMGV